jgi:hypothetical protein
MHRMDGWKQGFCPLQSPVKRVVDRKPISGAALILAVRALLLDVVESCPPLGIGML